MCRGRGKVKRGRCEKRDGFFISPSKENGGARPYNKSIGPGEATVRNKADLSGTAGRRASPPGSWRYLWVSETVCSPGRAQAVTEKSHTGRGHGCRLIAVKRVRGGTFRPGFAIEEVCVFETGLHLRRGADGGSSDRGCVGLFVPGPSPQGAAVGLLRGPAARAQGRDRPGTAQQSAAGPLPPLHHGGADRVFPRCAPYPFL